MEQSRTITRKSASNLALAFVLLPREKRDGMSALYAFCREVDDVADDPALVRSEKGNHSVNVRRLSNQPFTLPSKDGSVKGERASRNAQRCQEFA